MKRKIFVPSHITCFFSIFENKFHLKKGSCGAGILLDKGTTSYVKNNSNGKIAIKINGKTADDLISYKIAEFLRNQFLIDDGIDINHNIDVPIGSGFGTSAACAISTALAIKDYFDLKVTDIVLYQLAHDLEISLGTGLGDVLSLSSNGFVLRTKPGAPGIGRVKSLNLVENQDYDLSELFVISKTLSELNTASIIENPETSKKITEIGKKVQNEFIGYINLKNLLDLSYLFAIDTNLLKGELLKLVNELKENTLGASMAMLGNTVFAITTNSDNYLKKKDFLVSKIDNRGIRFI